MEAGQIHCSKMIGLLVVVVEVVVVVALLLLPLQLPIVIQYKPSIIICEELS